MTLFDADTPSAPEEPRATCTYYDDGRTCVHPGCLRAADPLPNPVPMARRSDPATSHTAASTVTNLRDAHKRILAILSGTWRPPLESGSPLIGGMTDEEIAAQWAHRGYPPISPSGLRTRRKELVDAGLVADSGQTRTTAAGRQTIVWVSLTDVEQRATLTT